MGVWKTRVVDVEGSQVDRVQIHQYPQVIPFETVEVTGTFSAIHASGVVASDTPPFWWLGEWPGMPYSDMPQDETLFDMALFDLENDKDPRKFPPLNIPFEEVDHMNEPPYVWTSESSADPPPNIHTGGQTGDAPRIYTYHTSSTLKII